MNTLLYASDFGMFSSLSIEAEDNACAMQCGYDGFEASHFLGDGHEPYLTAECKMGNSATGITKQAYMIVESLLQTFVDYSVDEINVVPIIFCLPQRPDIWDSKKNAQAILSKVQELLVERGITTHPHNQLVLGNRCAVVEAFEKADALTGDNISDKVAIVTSDSLVTLSAINHFSGDMYEDGIRMLTENNPNGFIPGEATVSFVVSKKAPPHSHIVCHGWGNSSEEAILGSGNVCNAKGLIKAIKNALYMADKKMSDMDFILSSVSGEDYFFKEVTLASTQALEKKVDDQPLWLPATHIGETGTAIGGAMLVMAYYAMQRGIAPGNTAIGMLSNDEAPRGSFVFEYKSGM